MPGGGARRRAADRRDCRRAGAVGLGARPFPTAPRAASLHRCPPRAMAVPAGRPARPGADDHAPCDCARCHRAEFLAGPARAAARSATRGWRPARSPGRRHRGRPTRRPDGRRALAAEFSHASHLDLAAHGGAGRLHVACSDCHEPAGDELPRPDHAVCGRCHAPEASPRGTPTMAECARCHVAGRAADRGCAASSSATSASTTRTTGRIGAAATSPAPVPPGQRRPAAPASSAPVMAACVECHDDSARTPPAQRMRMCETCHATRAGAFGSIAPRSHLPALERPEDHTRAFRRDHAADASADPQRCARCHTSMSGSPRDTCDDCHRVMRPQDHTVTWREYDHGPASAARSDGCAVCHQGDFCIACHQVRPRSHFPCIDFAQGGHGQFARVNLRSCVGLPRLRDLLRHLGVLPEHCRRSSCAEAALAASRDLPPRRGRGRRARRTGPRPLDLTLRGCRSCSRRRWPCATACIRRGAGARPARLRRGACLPRRPAPPRPGHRRRPRAPRRQPRAGASRAGASTRRCVPLQPRLRHRRRPAQRPAPCPAASSSSRTMPRCAPTASATWSLGTRGLLFSEPRHLLRVRVPLRSGHRPADPGGAQRPLRGRHRERAGAQRLRRGPGLLQPASGCGRSTSAPAGSSSTASRSLTSTASPSATTPGR